jgi:hypothetical protein
MRVLMSISTVQCTLIQKSLNPIQKSRTSLSEARAIVKCSVAGLKASVSGNKDPRVGPSPFNRPSLARLKDKKSPKFPVHCSPPVQSNCLADCSAIANSMFETME